MLRLIAVVLVLTTATASAQRSDVEEKALALVERTRELHRSLDAVRAIAYALRDPEALWHEAARIYGDILEDPVLGPLLENTVDLYRGGVVRIDGNVGATADLSVPAAVTASVDAAWELPLCRVVSANASGLVGYDEGDGLASYALGGGACLPLPANTIEVAYTRRDNVRTTLLQRPIVMFDRRIADEVDILIRFYRWRGKNHQIDFMPFELGIQHTRSAEGGRFGSWTSVVEAAPVEWRRRGKGLAGEDQVFEFMQVRAYDLRDDGSNAYSQAVRLTPLAIEGIHLQELVTVGLDVGIAFGGAGIETGAMMETPTIDKRGLHAEVNMRSIVGPIATELRATHTFVPLYDAQLARENRIAGQIQLSDPHYTIRGEGFLARETVMRDAPGGRSVIVGGGAGEVAWALMQHVHVIGRVELGNVLTAGLATDPVTTQRELRATLGVNAHYGRRSR